MLDRLGLLIDACLESSIWQAETAAAIHTKTPLSSLILILLPSHEHVGEHQQSKYLEAYGVSSMQQQARESRRRKAASVEKGCRLCSYRILEMVGWVRQGPTATSACTLAQQEVFCALKGWACGFFQVAALHRTQITT